MTELISEKTLKQKKIRHAEYYNLTTTFDELYSKSEQGKVFNKLYDIIVSDENIMLAYRNIKRNKGSNTAGADNKTIKDLETIPKEKFIELAKRKMVFYQPKPVKRVEIPKHDGKMRPLGIPTIWDRIVQQCILQVLEPICEAKFFERSNGFRPNRSAENAIAQCYRMVQKQHLYYVVDVDIKGFFDNVNHTKLRKQMWELGIQDKKVLSMITAMLKAPIILQNGDKITPDKGTPQGGLCSPLFGNIVLNELDWWIASQWENFPTRYNYQTRTLKNGTIDRSPIVRALYTTKLKEMYIIRYADDFKIFCRSYEEAKRVFAAVKLWLKERLNLDISEDKSKIINLRKNYSEFLGFKIKAVKKRDAYVVRSHMSNKAMKRETEKLIEQIYKMEAPSNTTRGNLGVFYFNYKVWGIHNYYKYATHISQDCARISRLITPKLKHKLENRIKKEGKLGKGFIRDRYGGSKQMRFVDGRPLCPIGYVQTKHPMYKRKNICKYTREGREEIHKNLQINMRILWQLMRSTETTYNIEYADNRISLYAAQYGKCAVTGERLEYDEIHCHHIIPKSLGGTDRYSNLIIVHKDIHKLIHATRQETIETYLNKFVLDGKMLNKINKLRKNAKLPEII